MYVVLLMVQGASMFDGSAILKPALARGQLRCLGCSSPDKFKKTIEKDPGLERRFQLVTVDPPNIEAATSILRGLRPRYEHHHGVTITESALLAAAKLSTRYISGRHLPDKAIDCLDEAAAQVRQCLNAPQYLLVLAHDGRGQCCMSHSCKSSSCKCNLHRVNWHVSTGLPHPLPLHFSMSVLPAPAACYPIACLHNALAEKVMFVFAVQVKMEAGSAPELLDALNRKIATLRYDRCMLQFVVAGGAACLERIARQEEEGMRGGRCHHE